MGLLLTTYLRAGNAERLYGEHAALLDEADFDLDAAGARILGRDLAGIAGRDTRVLLAQITEQGMNRERGEPLLRSLSIRYEEARRLLEALIKRLRES